MTRAGEVRPCRVCGGDLPPMTGRRGRPREVCDTCRPGVNRAVQRRSRSRKRQRCTCGFRGDYLTLPLEHECPGPPGR